MVNDRDPATDRKIGRWLPSRGLRSTLAAQIQDVRHNHWSRHIASRQTPLFHAIIDRVGEAYGLPRSVFQEMIRKSSFRDYTDRITRVFCSGLRDPAVAAALEGDDHPTVLFTGGGIVPAELLAIEKRFIHVHPGFLPDVRGGDGLLWSTLVRGRPGVSAIYMDPGIDTGAIIRAEECQPLAFNVPDRGAQEDQMLARALFAFYDPILRAQLFARLARNGEALDNRPATTQVEADGTLFHFMHPKLRRMALERLFPG